MTLRALITAGGTTEPIDDARQVTNFSTGRFGAELANALHARGVEVTLLAARSLAAHPEWIDPRVAVVPFGSVADLQTALDAALAEPPDLLFMAAAVSDYAPVPVAGKIRSDADELVVRMTRNPKILPTLRDRCPNALLCGFKLLSGVTPDELVAVARAQIATARLDLCLANDLSELGAAHPAWIVTPATAERVEGDKAHTAGVLADRVLALRPGVRPPADPRPVVRLTVPPGDDALLDRLSDALDGALLHTPHPAPFVARGWRPRPGGLLGHPAQRDDLLPAASVALIHRASGRLLLGRRTAGAWQELWAFPGGGVEPGEAVADAARRELLEETGLRAPTGPPLRETVVTVGLGDRAWRIHNLAWEVDDTPLPRTTPELDARWVSFEEAARLPMAVGTRRVLRALVG